MHLLLGAAGLDEGISCPLSSDEPRPVMTLRPGSISLTAGSNGIVVPELERVDRLHVVMAVEQHMRAVGRRPVVMGDDHRMAGRVAHAGIEADRLQIRDQPFGGLAAVGRIGGIGRDRRDAQQLEQPLEACVEIAVEAVEDGGECGHAEAPFESAPATLCRIGRNGNGLPANSAQDRAKPTEMANNRQKNAAVAEGTTTAALLQTMRQPGEGDEAAAMSGLGGGRAILRTSAKNRR